MRRVDVLLNPLRRAADRLVHPRRSIRPRSVVSEAEVEAWVETADEAYFLRLDEAFVSRACSLGVSSGMLLDVGSRLALIPMKILWHEEGLLSIGVYDSEIMAERGRATAADWGLTDRMFFQVGQPGQMRFKTHYFDMVVSDGGLHRAEDPLHLLKELGRIVKPGGAMLLRELARPARFQLGRRLRGEHASPHRGPLRQRFEEAVRAGFTPQELADLAERAGLTRAHVVREGIHVLLERKGSDDPDSWVTQREKYG